MVKNDIIRVDAFISRAMLEWMIQQEVNILRRYGNSGENLLFLAAKFDNEYAIRRLMTIDQKWVVDELKHTCAHNSFPWTQLQNPDLAAEVFPQQIDITEFILGREIDSQLLPRQLQQRQLQQRKLLDRDISPLESYEEARKLPDPLQKTAEVDKETADLDNAGAFATGNIVLYKKQNLHCVICNKWWSNCCNHEASMLKMVIF